MSIKKLFIDVFWFPWMPKNKMPPPGTYLVTVEDVIMLVKPDGDPVVITELKIKEKKDD